jgi:predicted ferric reductase
MKTILFALLALVTTLWAVALGATSFPPNSALPWIVRQEGLNLTGLLSIALMSLAMLLSSRPGWLEKPLGGLDQVYRLHKWAGILAVGCAAAHWLIKQSGGMIRTAIGVGGRLPKIKFDGLLEVLREFGKDMGEPALYVVLAMLAITLWRRVPYHLWAKLHRMMPVLYLMLAVHAAMLAPPAYWSAPVGALLAVCLTAGAVSSVIALGGLIGRRRRVKGAIVALASTGDTTQITCRLDANWPGHRPGQFAFISFGRIEGAHPFTIASADRGDRTITFCIKALGDFTRGLAQRIEVGQPVLIEGPYGRFLLERSRSDRRQIWVAGGIGITPFLAWLESLRQQAAAQHRADLHYCTRDRDNDTFVARLQTLCATLPGIRLHVHSARHGQRLTAGSLQLAADQRAELWFCGPAGLGESLRSGLRGGRLRFHQEAFAMR